MNIFWIALIVVVLIGYIMSQKENKKINVIFKKLALERNGKVKHVFGYYSQLIFPYKDVEIRVSAMSAGNGGTGVPRPAQTFSQFHFNKASDKHFFTISIKSTQTVIDNLVGFKNIHIDSPEFNDLFFIQSNDESFIKGLLTDEIQRKIISFDHKKALEISFQKSKFFNGEVWIEKPKLNVKIHKISTDEQDYHDLIEMTILFYEQIQKLK